ncbi:MAG: hypothetical protein GY882_01675 [Actinomycetia bacterium]|nr:hypothetical protein [Actinomycetes bacterium]MCP4844880.1 hypothetical protein [Actinomycetes bacterium]
MRASAILAYGEIPLHEYDIPRNGWTYAALALALVFVIWSGFSLTTDGHLQRIGAKGTVATVATFGLAIPVLHAYWLSKALLGKAAAASREKAAITRKRKEHSAERERRYRKIGLEPPK